MRKCTSLFATFSLLLVLSGCSQDLAKLRELSPSADDFSSALAAEYLAYSDAEAELGRRQSSEYFARKGLQAAKANIVLPDEVNVKAAGKSAAELAAARSALLAVLTQDVKHVAAQKAARAQMLFDCWVEQAGEKQTLRPASCKDGFAAALEELQAVADTFIHGSEAEHKIMFDAGSVALNDAALSTVAEVAHHVAGHADYAIELRGDAGRVAIVKDALVKAGVRKYAVTVARSGSGREVVLSNDDASDDVVMVVIKSSPIWKGRP